jgi:hypothetical protein
MATGASRTGAAATGVGGAGGAEASAVASAALVAVAAEVSVGRSAFFAGGWRGLGLDDGPGFLGLQRLGLRAGLGLRRFGGWGEQAHRHVGLGRRHGGRRFADGADDRHQQGRVEQHGNADAGQVAARRGGAWP